MKKGIALGLVLVSFSLMAGCSKVKPEVNDSDSKVKSEARQHEGSKSHLDYENQDEWILVSGEMQSPIDIVSKDTETMIDNSRIELNYDAKISKIEDNGHSLQVTGTGAGKINNREFDLAQLHFHAKSEHTLDGKHYPIEVHFVNQSQSGRLAVIGVFFEEGKMNSGFQEILTNFENKTLNDLKYIDTMFPDDMSYYHYLGSLTTPPLTENVEWYVMKNPVEVSTNQIETFEKLYTHNNREVQPVNKRVVLESNH